MSRSGYSDDLDNWALIKWRGQVMSAIRGKRGQQLLKDLIEALDALPEKKLIQNELKTQAGYCALGAVGAKRCLDLGSLDPDDPEGISEAFDIAPQLAQEIVYQNDEVVLSWQTPEKRWEHMRAWAIENLKNVSGEDTP